MNHSGMFDGINCFTLENERLSLTVTEYGASALSLRFDGREMILGYGSLSDYEASGSCAGGVVGRFANRIGGASFVLEGRRYALDANDGPNTLHGGAAGKPWHKRLWRGERDGEDAVVFTLLSPDGDNGFPGTVEARVRYLLGVNGVRMEFWGKSDRDTYFAPTSHIYFSLGERSVFDVEMQINARARLEVGRDLIPTGRILPAEGAYDFTSPRKIERDYDDCFILGGTPACTARTERVTLWLFTDFPALQFYTGRYLDCGISPNAGFAVEPEFYPDTPNKPDFPSALLRAGESFKRYLEFVFE